MDQRETLNLSGPHSYYMDKGIPLSGTSVQGLPGLNPLASGNVSFGSTDGSRGSIQPTLSGSPAFTAAVPRGPSAVTHGEPPIRRRRGRPRKYGPEGAISLVLSSSLAAPMSKLVSNQKKRGRPPGTGSKHQLIASPGGWPSSSAGTSFTPHVITASVGEDITEKILSFCDQGLRSICVLSANGAISTAILHQPSISGGIVSYEGLFEILCLSGSYLATEVGYPRTQNGGLTVSLASHEGQVIGGGVGGALIAASPIQVVVGSFICGDSKRKQKPGGFSTSSGHQTSQQLA